MDCEDQPRRSQRPLDTSARSTDPPTPARSVLLDLPLPVTGSPTWPLDPLRPDPDPVPDPDPEPVIDCTLAALHEVYP